MIGSSVISNTGPLVALAVIDQLDLLNQLFDTIIVPEAVHFELLEGGIAQAGVAAYRKAQWIAVKELTNPREPLLDSVFIN